MDPKFWRDHVPAFVATAFLLYTARILSALTSPSVLSPVVLPVLLAVDIVLVCFAVWWELRSRR